MTELFRPMLAADISDDLEKLRFPTYATPKLDGVRALVFAEGLKSRSMKPIPNRFTQSKFGGDRDLIGLDGELIVGKPTASDVYRTTNSAVSSQAGEPEVSFYVFDAFCLGVQDYARRLAAIQHVTTQVFTSDVILVPSVVCYDMTELERIEGRYLEEGYEGLILRNPEMPYKNNRSTLKEQGMLKLKRFKDSEAVILSMEEEMENRNEAKTNELGRTERSAHKENLVGKGRMGALVVRDAHTNVEFKVGTGFTAEDRTLFWRDAAKYIGKTVKYKYFPVGVKDKPRHPTYIGMREGWDL